MLNTNDEGESGSLRTPFRYEPYTAYGNHGSATETACSARLSWRPPSYTHPHSHNERNQGCRPTEAVPIARQRPIRRSRPMESLSQPGICSNGVLLSWSNFIPSAILVSST